MTRTRIKICGLTREADVDAAVAAGADAVGFMLYPKSKRAITAEHAGLLARRLPPLVTAVLVLVNASADEIEAGLREVPNALLQFHGDESPADCRVAGRPYLRAVRMEARTDLVDWAARFPDAAGLLLDAPVEGYGGGGKVFDWSLASTGVRIPVVLSGGLNPANVTAGVAQVRPFAVDVSSGVESAPGIKDAALMRRFCAAVRLADGAAAAT